MSVVGWRNSNNEASTHNQPQQGYATYLTSGDFIEGVFENWESEFLAVGSLLLLSIKLRERGSPESKPVGKRYDHQAGG